VPADVERLRFFQRSHSNDFERPGETRTVREERRQTGWGRLAEDRKLAGIDRRQHGIQKTLGAPRVLSRVERFLERGKVPDRPMLLQVLD
jgi:hypothetical protein